MAYTPTAFHDQLRRSPELSNAAVRVALILSGYADPSGHCFPSQGRIARDLDWKLLQVKRAMRELQDAGIVEYHTRARHQGETSLIYLRTGITVATGSRKATGIKKAGEPVSPESGTGITTDTQNSPRNSPNELTQVPTGAETAPWVGEEGTGAQEVVAHAVTFARARGLTLSADRKARLGRAAKPFVGRGVDWGLVLHAVETVISENRPPTDLEYILTDLMTGRRRHGDRASSAGKSLNGEY